MQYIMKAVTVENISKSYGKLKAIENISFEVEKAEIFGLIGPDGAGKTSIFRILTSLILPDNGKAHLLNYDVVKDYRKIRQIIGYMPGRFSLYPDLSVEENLNFFASVFGTTIEENYDLVKDIYHQIEPFKKRRAGALSGGMKQKLALSCALIHKPEVLILDEPTTGVDAVSRKEFWEMLRKLKDKGITILVSTPYMDEASLCDRVALIQKGKIMQIDTPAEIVKRFDKKLYAIRTENIYDLLVSLRNFELTNSVFPFGQFVHFTAKDDLNNMAGLNDYLLKNNFKNIEINEINPGIEDCFMALMK
jgi:ABC-type multidrug transport system ATPase subunit